MSKNIVIYPHNVFNNLDGGTTVQYYLAYILDNLGRNVMICNKHDNNSNNSIFNKFICENEIDNENTIVIYCEGIIGNPLNAKYIVRWMLSKLGQNVPKNYYFTWGKNELVYFFNTEIDLVNNDIYFKQLSVFYLYEEIKNLNVVRKGVCYTNRKKSIHQKINIIHSDDAFEITRQHSQNELIEIFNNHYMFISYDPLTFLNLIAAMCGCISVVYPIEGVSKKNFLKMTALYEYLVENNTDIYGLAYGMDESEILYAQNTIHLVKKQMEDIKQWFINKYVINFIKDIDNFDNNKNILSYYKNIMLFNSTENEDFEIEFYRKNNPDLIHMTYDELFYHYTNYGKKEGRFCSEKQLKDFIEDGFFDASFYKNHYKDLNNMSYNELFYHYTNYGKKEGRICSKKQIKDFVEDQDFNVDFYIKVNPDLNNFSYIELSYHYKKYGKNEGRFCSEKQIRNFVEDQYFDVDFYKKINPQLNHMSYNELIHHYKNSGKKNGLFGSKEQIRAFVDDENFDIEIYKKYNPDLNHMSYNEQIHHYINFGKKEGHRFYSEKQLRDLVKNDDFDIEIYKKYNPDLNHMTYPGLIYHYINYGKNECRPITEKEKNILDSFVQLYPDFDAEYFKLFNPQLCHMCKKELMIYYFKNINWNIFELNQINFQVLNSKIRVITTYSDVQQNFKIEFYNIYNKDTFLKYYSDFDIDFYKKTYLSDANMSETDIFLHYHTIGKINKFLTNNIVTIVFYSLILNPNCGGLVVMHNMVKMINNLNIPNIRAKIFNPFNLIYKNEFTDQFCDLYEINDNYIVVYPEIIYGNPLNCKNVIRWILLELGVEMPKNHYLNWNKSDLVYFWESKKTGAPYYKQLCYPWFDTQFINFNKNERTSTCFMMKKAFLFHENITTLHPENSIKIDDYSNTDDILYTKKICNIFNECKYFYCYDPNSALIIFSAICGCIPIVYPLKNISKDNYLENRIFNCGGKNVDFIAYGNSHTEIEYAENNLKNINTYIEYFKDYYSNTINNFINDIKDINNNLNIIEKYYENEIDINNFKFIDYDVKYLYNINFDEKLDLFDEQKKYFENNKIEYYDDYYKIDNHENYFKFIKKSLQNGKINIKSPWSNLIIETDLYFTISLILDDSFYKKKFYVANYLFKDENIIIGIGLGTINPFDTKILYLINLNKKQIIYLWDNYYIDKFKENILPNVFKKVIEFKNINIDNLEKKNITIYSYQENLGHQVFNELTGLHLLNYYGLFNYVDTIYLGLQNNLNIYNFFENKKTIYIENEIGEYFGKGILFKYNTYFLSDKCVNFYINYLDKNFNNEQNFIDSLVYIKKHYPIINITIRLKTNYMIDQVNILIEVINYLSKQYPSAYFLLDGYCGNSNGLNLKNEDLDDYLKIANEIKNKIISKNCTILIGLEINKLIKFYKLCNYSIYQVGSICCLASWLCNIPGIQFGRENVSIYKFIDKNIRENMTDIKYITDGINFLNNCFETSSENIIKHIPKFTDFNTQLYNKYNNNTEFKEKIYTEEMNISEILNKLKKNNSKILVCNADYTSASGGITVLHYFCHLLNYVTKQNIAYICRLKWLPDRTFKKIDDYNESDLYLETNPDYLTPNATKDLLLNRNNIVIYMDSVYGNPLEQKYVVRWVLYFELSHRIKTWNENDLIFWFIDTYKKYSKYIQIANGEDPITNINNKQYIMSIISNVNKILDYGNETDYSKKNGICFTTRKAGNNINQDRKLINFEKNIIENKCNSCMKNKWPCICDCKDYSNGVKLIHNSENLVYRFEYPTNLNDEIELFKKTNKFYMYDPFCFSAVIAALNGCLTIVPKLDCFGDDDPYENVSWMKYGIVYGNDSENINKASELLPQTKQYLEKLFYEINYENIYIFFNALNDIVQ